MIMTTDGSNGSHARNSPDNDVQKRIQILLNKLQLDDEPAGAAVVVYHKGSCIVQANVGMANADVMWQSNTLALNFSTGKGILATLVHVLVSQQRIEYDLPIAKYWADFGVNGKAKITLRQVMSHQANLFAISSIDVDTSVLLDWKAMLGAVAAMPMTTPDNAADYESAYSALVYGWILGGLIEAVTDMTLAEALRYYLTDPLGISDECYFGVPENKVHEVAKLTKDFETSESLDSPSSTRRQKPVLKAESEQILATYEELPSYSCWQLMASSKKLIPVDSKLTASKINRLYFDHSAINAINYRAALVPANKHPIDYYNAKVLQAIIPAANGVASAKALAIIYAMLADRGTWQGKTLIDSQTFAQLSIPQVMGMDAVMPAEMNWRLGYHRLFTICRDSSTVNDNSRAESGFGHMGYNGSVAWCDPQRELSFAFVHNFDVTMLNDIRQFALTEALLDIIDHL